MTEPIAFALFCIEPIIVFAIFLIVIRKSAKWLKYDGSLPDETKTLDGDTHVANARRGDIDETK